MKKIFTLLAASLASLGLHAQITLTQSDYVNWKPTVDTFQDINLAASPAANADIDLTTATYDPQDTFSYGYSPYTNASFPNVSYAYLTRYDFSSMGYYSIITGGIAANGVLEYGQVIPLQAFDISSMTMRTGDSLTFPAQNILYSTPRKRLSLPMSFGSTYVSSFNYATNFVLKYNSTNYAGNRKTYTTQVDSVTGWGRVRIKRLNGSTSAWMNVLGVKTKTYTTDSFALPGQPSGVVTALLSGFGLKQGMRDSSYYVQFLRKGEIEAVYVVGQDDSTYTSPNYATVHQSRIPVSGVGVSSLPAASGIKLFPNPATATGGFDIELTEIAAGTWSYNLLDASGKVVSSAAINPNGNKAHVNAAQAAPGTYFLNLQKDGQQVGTQPVIIK